MRHLGFLLVLFVGCGAGSEAPLEQAEKRIRPWSEDSRYWEYGGEPVLLLGASDDDNLFQWPDKELRTQLDRLAAVSGNYVRNTMSDRNDRGWEIHAYGLNPEARYDLDTWNEEYWQRFERFLQWTAERNIIVQIEVWDRFDYTDNRDAGHWQRHPLNPRNNINYTYEESGYEESYPDHPGRNKQPFFFSTPNQRNNELILGYQQKFVDKMLSYTLRHGHVLYCIDNETKAEPEWGRYWAEYIKGEAAEVGAEVYVTEMWDDWDIKSEQHRHTMDHPGLYDYVDVSQNNHNTGDEHWENFLYVKQELAQRPRPINTVKTYGADGGRYGTDHNAIARVVRHVLAGAASARFHRPPSGLGLNEKAQGVIKALRAMEAEVKAWEMGPDMEALIDRADAGEHARDEGEAYVATSARAAVVYFPAGGQVALNMPAGEYALTWYNVVTGEQGPRTELTLPNPEVGLETPDEGHWLAVLAGAK